MQLTRRDGDAGVGVGCTGSRSLFNKNFTLVSKKKARKRKKTYLGARDASRAPERPSFGDVALIAGISRPKRRYEPSFGPFFGLWGGAVLTPCTFLEVELVVMELDVVVVTVGWHVEVRCVGGHR